jgi:hypothetical protein
MTFEEYLKKNTSYVKSYGTYLDMNCIEDVIKHAENWHAQELKYMSQKGANTTNTRYSKEQRSEWAKLGAIARMKKKTGDKSNDK